MPDPTPCPDAAALRVQLAAAQSDAARVPELERRIQRLHLALGQAEVARADAEARLLREVERSEQRAACLRSLLDVLPPDSARDGLLAALGVVG